MSDKGLCLSNFGGSFLHLNTGNGTMPLNSLLKQPPYVLFLKLYEFLLYVCCINVLYECCIFFGCRSGKKNI